VTPAALYPKLAALVAAVVAEEAAVVAEEAAEDRIEEVHHVDYASCHHFQNVWQKTRPFRRLQESKHNTHTLRAHQCLETLEAHRE
jgi:hypothetical protein